MECSELSQFDLEALKAVLTFFIAGMVVLGCVDIFS